MMRASLKFSMKCNRCTTSGKNASNRSSKLPYEKTENICHARLKLGFHRGSRTRGPNVAWMDFQGVPGQGSPRDSRGRDLPVTSQSWRCFVCAFCPGPGPSM
eukprot:1104965-Pyramimonas_sp.AAC.1